MRKLLSTVLAIQLIPIIALAQNADFELLLPAVLPEAGMQAESASAMADRFSVGLHLQLEKDPAAFGSLNTSELLAGGVTYRFQARALVAYRIAQPLMIGIDVPVTIAQDQYFTPVDPIQSTFGAVNDAIVRGRLTILERSKYKLALSAHLRLGFGDSGNLTGRDGRFAYGGGMILNEIRLDDQISLRFNAGYEEKPHTQQQQTAGIQLNDEVLWRVGLQYAQRDDIDIFAEFAGAVALETPNSFDSKTEFYLGLQKSTEKWSFGPTIATGLARRFGVLNWRILWSTWFKVPNAPMDEEPETELIPLGLSETRIYVTDSYGMPISSAEVVLETSENKHSIFTSDTGLARFAIPATPITVIASAKGYASGIHEYRVHPGVNERFIELESSTPVLESSAQNAKRSVGAPLGEYAEQPPQDVMTRIVINIIDKKTTQPITEGTIHLIDYGYHDDFENGKFTYITGSPKTTKVSVTVPGYDSESTPINFASALEHTISIEQLAKIEGSKLKLSKKIVFKTGKAIINEDSAPVMKSIFSILQRYIPNNTIHIEGHTDSRGSESFNNKLSQDRADAIKEYLVDLGLDGDYLISIGKGPSEPIADNETAEGREANRRVEFKLAD